MVGARCGEQQRFGAHGPAIPGRIQQERADRLGTLRAARLACEHGIETCVS